MRIRIALTVTIRRDRRSDPPAPEVVTGPERHFTPTAQVERAEQWDHDKRPPLGFQPN